MTAQTTATVILVQADISNVVQSMNQLHIISIMIRTTAITLIFVIINQVVITRAHVVLIPFGTIFGGQF